MSSQLSQETIDIVKQCLHAAAEGPFFPDWEFQTLFGIDRDVVREVYKSWPEQSVSDDDFECAVIGSLGHLLGYPHNQEGVWASYISVSPERVRSVLDELIAADL